MLDIMLVTLDELTAVRQLGIDFKNERGQKERLYADMARCKGNPQTCGVGIWRAWTTAEREGTMDEFYKSHKHIGDTKNRIAELNQLIETNKLKEASMIATHNKEEAAKVVRQLTGEEAKLKRFELKAQHRGGHPESTGTVKPTSRRTKHGTVKRRRPIMQRRR